VIETLPSTLMTPVALSPAAAAPSGVSADARTRLEVLFTTHFDFIWRSLRRFGLSEDRADDAAQQVFMIASRKLDAIKEGSERSFLFGTAMRVASDIRKSAPVRREVVREDVGVELEGGARPDDLLEQRQAREMLDKVLDAMDLDLRAVFVLFELEEMSTNEIASLLSIPHGTVASRLRRAREDFERSVRKLGGSR
jgi:RNA polymerase sigma-70 factor, ECF subfamily